LWRSLVYASARWVKPRSSAADRALLSGRVVRILQDHSSLLALAGSGYLAFSEWTSTFTDPPLCAAIVDRLTFDAHIINTGTDSYRLYTAKPGRPPGPEPRK